MKIKVLPSVELLRMWVCLYLTLVIVPSVAQEYKIREIQGQNDELIVDILEMAFEKQGQTVSLTPLKETQSDQRLISELNAGTLDIIWSGASQVNDNAMRTVRIPILKGMLGHRIFITRRDKIDMMRNVSTLTDLNEFRAGQGTQWGDTKVLQEAGISTVTTLKYHNLFPMLEGGRFDYFPRALHEPWGEVASRPALDLAIEPNVMLVYPYALYFYVAKDNKPLHDIIYNGLLTAIEDGSYADLFYNAPVIVETLKKVDASKRRVIRIDNPFMHEDTPLDKPEFWLELDKM